ncbi:MAG: rhodanese-like domain-containing protein [Myxococcota bacterium]|nr:rhodanese-like domain-containing protein [Myxococcota bacterium]
MSSPEIAELTADQALEFLEAGTAVFIDVRDKASYRRGHLPGAQHIGDHNVEEFIRDTEKTAVVVVYCYHGNSSLGGAAYLQENGFGEVYSMSGGFADWEGKPTESSARPVDQAAGSAAEHAPPTRRVRGPVPEASTKRGGLLRRAAKGVVRRLLR